MTGKYTINYFQYQEDVGCVCMLNGWISSNDEICPDNYNYYEADEGNIHHQLLPVPRGRWVRLHAQLLDQLLRRNLRRQLQLLRFKLKGEGRSVKWEVYLFGDKTMKVERDSAEVLIMLDTVSHWDVPQIQFIA